MRRSIPPRFLCRGERHDSSFPVEIDELLLKRDLVTLREMLKNGPPSAVVWGMTELDTADQMIVRRILPRELAAEAFQSLDLPSKNGC